MNARVTGLLATLTVLAAAAAATTADFHAMFQPLRVVRFGDLAQVELAIELTNLTSASAHVELTFVGSRSLDGRFHKRLGDAQIGKGQAAHLTQVVTVPEREVDLWLKQGQLPRVRVRYHGPSGTGEVVIDAVPSPPPEEPLGSR